VVIVSVSHALAVLAPVLPKYAWAAQWALVVTYSCWMLSAVPILLQASRKVVAKKLTFTGDATVVCSGGNAREVWFMNGAMSFSDACAYFLHVTVNLQLNNLCRAPRFVASMLYSLYAFGAIRPKQRTDEAAYYFGMHSSLHRWLREDGHLHFPNCLLWARDPALDRTWLDRWFWSFFRGNTTRHFNLITFKLNHELGICTELGAAGQHTRERCLRDHGTHVLGAGSIFAPSCASVSQPSCQLHRHVASGKTRLSDCQRLGLRGRKRG